VLSDGRLDVGVGLGWMKDEHEPALDPLLRKVGEGDKVRLLACAASEDGTEPEDPDDGEHAQDWRQEITDPATGLSRLLSERCPTQRDPRGRLWRRI
jgi:hypothetical protein